MSTAGSAAASGSSALTLVSGAGVLPVAAATVAAALSPALPASATCTRCGSEIHVITLQRSEAVERLCPRQGPGAEEANRTYVLRLYTLYMDAGNLHFGEGTCACKFYIARIRIGDNPARPGSTLDTARHSFKVAFQTAVLSGEPAFREVANELRALPWAAGKLRKQLLCSSPTQCKHLPTHAETCCFRRFELLSLSPQLHAGA